MFHHLWVTGCMWTHSVGSAWNNESGHVELQEQVSSGLRLLEGSSTRTITCTVFTHASPADIAAQFTRPS